MDNCLSSMVYISPRSRPHEKECEQLLARALIDRGSSSLERLLVLQDKGWNDESTERHFRKQRHTADTASPDLNMIWFRRMKSLFAEIDRNVNIVSSYERLEFLDLGCCPGGFSSYILDKNTCAIGIGVSLPMEQGGHEFSLEYYHRKRYNLLSADLTYFELGSFPKDSTRLQPLPSYIASESFDVILLDGHQLRTQTSSMPWDRDRLLISQLIIALQSIKKGGTIVIKLPLPHRHSAARVLVLLRMLSSELVGWKPVAMHANRGQFYAVAKGIGNGEMGSNVQQYIDGLGSLWSALTFGGEGEAGRPMVPEDLDFIVSMDEVMDHHLEWLKEYGDPFWRVQADALETFYRRRGV